MKVPDKKHIIIIPCPIRAGGTEGNRETRGDRGDKARVTRYELAKDTIRGSSVTSGPCHSTHYAHFVPPPIPFALRVAHSLPTRPNPRNCHRSSVGFPLLSSLHPWNRMPVTFTSSIYAGFFLVQLLPRSVWSRMKVILSQKQEGTCKELSNRLSFHSSPIVTRSVSSSSVPIVERQGKTECMTGRDQPWNRMRE